MKLLARAFALVFLSFCFVEVGAKEVGVQVLIDDNAWQTEAERQEIVDDVSTWVHETEEFYRNSGVVLRPFLANVSFGNFTGNNTDRDAIFNRFRNEVGDMGNVLGLADEFGADYTVLLVDQGQLVNNEGEGLCGSALQVSSSLSDIDSLARSFAVMTTSPVCRAFTFSHELGHLQGLVHGDYVNQHLDGNHVAGRLLNDNRAKGWGEGNADGTLDDDEFGTIMVGNYQSQIEGWRDRIPVFSNITINWNDCGSDGVCGDQVNGDAAAVLNQYSDHYVSHAEKDVHTINYLDSNLLSCISDQYPASNGSPGNDITSVDTIRCSNRGIGSIHGVEEVVGLENSPNAYIDFSENRIGSVIPLKNVHSSAMIDLRGNDHVICSQLESLVDSHGNLLAPDKCFNLGAFIAAQSILL